MTFTAFLIGLALDSTVEDLSNAGIRNESRDFAALAYLAFGHRGRQALAVIFALELWMAILAFFVLIGINGNLVLGISKTDAIIVAGALTFSLCFASMRFLGYLSMLSMLTISTAVVALIWSGMSLPVTGKHFDSYHAGFRPDGLFCSRLVYVLLWRA